MDDGSEEINQLLAEALSEGIEDEDVNAETEYKIPADKVLTASATEYCNSINKDINTYNLVGVHGNSKHLMVPLNTEVVVDFQGTYTHGDNNMGCGTALVKKDKTELEQHIGEMKND